MLDLTFCPDGSVLVPSGGDPAAAHCPTGWSRAFLGMDLGRNDPSAFVLIKDQCVPVRSANGGRILLGARERTVVWADRVRDTSYPELAAYVDEKMRLALKECPSGDTLKVAVLAALNIADEYFRAGDEVHDRQAGFAHRARELERMLDMALAAGQERLAAG